MMRMCLLLAIAYGFSVSILLLGFAPVLGLLIVLFLLFLLWLGLFLLGHLCEVVLGWWFIFDHEAAIRIRTITRIKQNIIMHTLKILAP